MKKILYSLAAVATLLFAASCAKDKETDLPDYLMGGTPVEVTFGVNAGEGLMTKAIADGLTATKLEVGWYEVSDNAVTFCDSKDAVLNNLAGNVTLTLAKGKTYKVVFWAAPADGPYTVNFENQIVSLTENLNANDEKNDAFYAVAEYTVAANPEAQEVTLKRPMAQIAVISPVENIDNNDVALETTGITVANVYTIMNLLTGACDGPGSVTFANAAPFKANNALTVAKEGYYYVAVGYVFAPAEGYLSNISFNANAAQELTYEVQNAQLKRNYRTVISGNILPAVDPNADVEWTVTVDPEFGGDNEANIDAVEPEVTFVDPDDPQASPVPAAYDDSIPEEQNEAMELGPNAMQASFQVQSESEEEIAVSSSNEEVATAAIDDQNNVTIDAVGNGTAIITIHQDATNGPNGIKTKGDKEYTAFEYKFLVKVEGIETPQPGEGYTFEKVTAISEGEYLIVYEDAENPVAFDGSLETLEAVSNNFAVVINDGKIELENKNSIFTIAAIDGGYSIKSASGKYIGGTSGSNKLNESETEAYLNTITFNNGNAVITSNTSFIQYNKTSGQERFRYYKSGTTSQQPVALYKLSGGSTPQPNEPQDPTITLTTDPANITELNAGESFELTVTTDSTGEITVVADEDQAVTIEPKQGAENVWVVTANEVDTDTDVQILVNTAEVEDLWNPGEDVINFTVKAAGEVPPVQGNDGSAEHPYTVAEALDIIAGLEANAKSDEFHVTGVVKSVTEIANPTYKNATYIISDAGEDNELTIFRGKGIDGADITDDTLIEEGDVVVVKGTLENYNSTTPEMSKDNQLVSIVKDTTPKFGATINSEADVLAAGGTRTISVTGNVAWTAAVTGAATLDVNAGEGKGTIVVTIPENTSTTATPSFTVTVSTEAEVATKVVEFTINQAAATGEPGNDGSAEHPYTVAEAIALIDAGAPTDEVHVTGVVKSVGNINTNYNSITYFIKDADVDNEFQIYSGKGLNGADVVGTSPVDVGDVVVVKGVIKKYNTTYEMDKNSQIISIIKDETPKFGATLANETAVAAAGGTKTINVTGNVAWTAQATGGATLDPASGEGAGTITVTIPENTDTENTKSYNVTLSADGFDNIVLTINQNKAASATTAGYVLFSGDLVEGDYIIFYDGKAMNTTVDKNRLQYLEVTPTDGVIYEPDASIVWHIAASGEYWTIYNAAIEQYAAGTGTKNQAAVTATQDDKILWTVTADNGTYEFVNKYNAASSVNANLRNNGTYGFATYSTTTGGALSLYKYNGN